MIHIFMIIFVFILFFILTPGVVLKLPPKGSTAVVAAVHAVVFTIIFGLTHKLVWNFFYGNEHHE